ncbi:hypothetical protein EB118_22080 [bacterium]|nr:hypothetical protein [bacterium]NDG32745.1 hypothetical protein [bacterium]
MNKEWYVIKDMEQFVDKTRTIVFNSFGSTDKDNNIYSLSGDIKPEDQQELDAVLSYDESMIIAKGFAKKQVHKKNKKTRYLITDNIFYQIVQSLNNRTISNLLNTLVNKGLVETAFDEQSNDFIFWVNNENSTNEKPETD